MHEIARRGGLIRIQRDFPNMRRYSTPGCTDGANEHCKPRGELTTRTSPWSRPFLKPTFFIAYRSCDRLLVKGQRLTKRYSNTRWAKTYMHEARRQRSARHAYNLIVGRRIQR